MKIINIRRGRGPRAKWIYAELVDSDGKLLIVGTIEYIVARLEQLVPAQPEEKKEKQS